MQQETSAREHLAVLMTRHGGPEVLEAARVPTPRPAPGQVLLDVGAVGVNYIDTYLRSGLYPSTPPCVPGAEAAGRVLAVGDGVTDVAAGDLVASCDVPGAYAARVLVDAGRTVPVPEEVGAEQAAAVLLQGLTAHYLAHDTFPVGPGHRVLVHAAAGGVGQLLVQTAAALGAEVFATVGSDAKGELAREAGAHHVVNYRSCDFAEAVERIAGPRPLDVVYDGVGRATFRRGLDLLRPRGTMVTFGNASGPVDPVRPLDLSTGGSLFLTRPTLADHVRSTAELRRRAAELLAEVATGRLRVRIGARLPLERAAAAHRLLEGRETTGKVLLLP